MLQKIEKNIEISFKDQYGRPIDLNRDATNFVLYLVSSILMFQLVLMFCLIL